MIAIILGAFRSSCLKKIPLRAVGHFETGVLPNVSCVVLLFIGLYDELTDAVKKQSII
jgi:hypothetical protein